MSESAVWGRSLTFWARTTLAYLMLVTVTGALVRLTGSGLGCTDWPTCESDAATVELSFHPLIEFGNRIISGLAIVPVIAVYLAARHTRRDLLRWVRWLVAGFLGQVVLGMIVTRTELDARFVLGHFLLSMVLVGLAAILVDRVDLRDGTPAGEPRYFRLLRIGMVVVSAAAIVVGTLVTGSGPHTGSDDAAEPIPRLGFDIFQVTRIHSVIVWVLATLIGWGLWSVRSSYGTHRRRLTVIAIIGAAQAGIGYGQYFMGVPAVLVALHITGAVVLWTAICLFALNGPRTPAQFLRSEKSDRAMATQ